MAKEIILNKEKELKLDIDAAKAWTFEDWYQFGMKMEQAGLVDTGFGGKSTMTPKYLNWAVILRVLKAVYPDFKQITVAHEEAIMDGAFQLGTVTVPYTSVHGVNFVEAGFSYTAPTGVETYTTILPIMTTSFQDVDAVKATRMNYSHKRAFVKAVAEHFGLGLHLWTKEEVEETEEKVAKKAERKTAEPAAKVEVKPSEAPKAAVLKTATVVKTTPVVKAEPIAEKAEAPVLKPTVNFELVKEEVPTYNTIVTAAPNTTATATPIDAVQQAEYVKEVKTLLSKVHPDKKEVTTANLKAHFIKHGVARISELPLTQEAYQDAIEILKGGI